MTSSGRILLRTIGAGQEVERATALGLDQRAHWVVTIAQAGGSNRSPNPYSADFACSGTADGTYIKSIISLLPSTGGILFFQPGAYAIDTQLVIPGHVTVMGAGYNVTRFNAAANIDPFWFVQTGTPDEFIGGGFSDATISASGALVIGIRISHIMHFVLNHIKFQNSACARCVQVDGASFHTRIQDCRLVSFSQYGIYLTTYETYFPNGTQIENTDLAADDAATAIYTDAAVVGVKIKGNWTEWAASKGGTAIDLNGGASALIVGNRLGANGSASSVAQIRHRGAGGRVTIVGNDISVDRGNGISLEATGSQGSSITGNIFIVSSPTQHVITGTKLASTVIAGNRFSLGSAPGISGSVINLPADELSVVITGNYMECITKPPTAAVGITIAATAAAGPIIVGNHFDGFVTGIADGLNNAGKNGIIDSNTFSQCTTSIAVTNVASQIIRNNIGYVTENSGASTGTGAQQTVAHGLTFTPTAQRIALTGGSATALPYHSAAPDATNIYVTAANLQAWYWATVG